MTPAVLLFETIKVTALSAAVQLRARVT